MLLDGISVTRFMTELNTLDWLRRRAAEERPTASYRLCADIWTPPPTLRILKSFRENSCWVSLVGSARSQGRETAARLGNHPERGKIVSTSQWIFW